SSQSRSRWLCSERSTFSSAPSTSAGCATNPSGTPCQTSYASSCVAYGWPPVVSRTRLSASSSIPLSVAAKRSRTKGANFAGEIERLACRRVDVAVNGLRQRGREALLRRDPQEIAVADEDSVRDRLLGSRQDERRLAVAPWRVDEDVLAVAHGSSELCELVIA